MFIDFFDLETNPFGMTSGLDYLYKSRPFEESMAHLVYGLTNNEAIILITGPIGSGKTMCLQSFLSGLGREYHFALVTNTQVTHVELLKLILDDLGIQLDPQWDKSDLLIAFKDYLIESRKQGKKIVVVIDEAQNLGAKVLEEVRLLTNLGQGADQLVQLILVGQPELQEVLERPDLAQLRQRIRVHYQVEKLNFEEMVGYVEHRLAVAGCRRRIFEADAFMRLFEISNGVPRLVNTHAGNAILSAFVAQREMVTVQDVEEGVAEEIEGPPASLPDPRPAPKSERDPKLEPNTNPLPLPAFEQEPPTEAPNDIPPPSPKGDGTTLPALSAPEIEDAPVQEQKAEAPWGSFDAGGLKEEKKTGRGGLIWAFLIILVLGSLVFWYTQFPESFPWQPSNPALAPDSGTRVESGSPPAIPDFGTTPPQVEAEDVVASKVDSLNALEDLHTTKPDGPGQETDAVSNADEVPDVPPVHFIHVASFRNRERSLSVLDRFRGMGFSGLIKKKVVNGVEWHRVYLGPFARNEDALEGANDLMDKKAISFFSIIEEEAPSPGRQ